MDVVAIISNHPKEALTIKSWLEDVPYHYFPITKDTKAEQEPRIKATIEATGAELIIMERYMQILSEDLASFLSGWCINIHQRFLPRFKCAKTYNQAHSRGVKRTGDTSNPMTDQKRDLS